MNYKPIDHWSILHFALPLVLTFGEELNGYSFLSVILLIFIYEILEQVTIGDIIFQWELMNTREHWFNVVMDIIIGLLGVMVALLIISYL